MPALDALSCAQSSVPGKSAEPTFRYSVLDNGDFAEANTTVVDARGARPIPWWTSSRGLAMRALERDKVWITVDEEGWLEQPLPAFGPLLRTLEFRGIKTDGASWTLTDGQGQSVTGIGGHITDGSEFPVVVRMSDLWPGGEVGTKFGREPSPRFTLRLHGREAGASWRHIEAYVELPCPSEAALRAEIVDLLKWIFATFFERAIDDIGPRKTAILCKDFDAVTGESLPGPRSIGFGPLYQSLFDALSVEEVPEWRAQLERFLEDFLTLQIQPETGLPREWDPRADVPDEHKPVEIGVAFSFLIDVAERGPERFRQRAKLAATKIGETVLAHGLLPDGNCAAKYFPKDGKPDLNVNQLHRLDVPAQLVRLTKLTGDPRFARAAREPLATLEYTNLWAGTWDQIDNGFDDEFGHYGARGATAALAAPDEQLFRHFALEGWKHYAPIWRDALRFGGSIAADQVRCWRIGVDLAHLEPAMRADIGALLRIAARSHFKGEQYGNGAWGDVTIFDFSPKTKLQVHDFTGSPQNLLSGLASIYADEIGLRTDEIRAMYTAVLRSSVTQYKRPYGFLLESSERRGQNSASGSLRMLLGLETMLRALSKPH
jgi:hypothetical protein